MAVPNRELFKVNLRDGLCCQNCGRRPISRVGYHRGFEYHHRTHRADGGADVAGNLVLVCHACHLLHHQGKVDLAALPRRDVPAPFSCKLCGAENDPDRVTMNCGYYRCQVCGRRVHLFDHAGLVAFDFDAAGPAPA